jgi:hypothetical protein
MVHGSAYSTRQLLQIAEDYARVDPEASVQMLVNSTLGGEDAQGPEAMMRFFDRIIERDLSNNESPESASSILSMAIGLGIDVFRDNVKRMKRVNGIEQTELHTQTERLCDFLGNAYGKLISLKDFQSPDDAIDAIKNAPFNGKNRMLYRHEAYATVAAALARQGHLEAAVTLVHSTENAVHEGHPGLQQTAARAYADVANGLRQRRLSEQ